MAWGVRDRVRACPLYCETHQAVADGGVAQAVIKTMIGHGYRFISAVVTCQLVATTPVVPPLLRQSMAEAGPPPLDMPAPLAYQPQTRQSLLVGERKQATVLAVGVKGIPALA